MQTMLQQRYPDKRVFLMTTDGFLLPTQELINRGILDRKGFPESYDMEALVHFLLEVKTGNQAWMRRSTRMRFTILCQGKCRRLSLPTS